MSEVSAWDIEEAFQTAKKDSLSIGAEITAITEMENDVVVVLGYCITQRAWYASSLPASRRVPEVIVGRYRDDLDGDTDVSFNEF